MLSDISRYTAHDKQAEETFAPRRRAALILVKAVRVGSDFTGFAALDHHV
jgi:hypothetical protein